MVSIQALQARIASVKPAPVQGVILSLAAIVRRDNAHNIRTLQSIIEESDTIDSHELDSIENASFLASFEE